MADLFRLQGVVQVNTQQVIKELSMMEQAIQKTAAQFAKFGTQNVKNPITPAHVTQTQDLIKSLNQAIAALGGTGKAATSASTAMASYLTSMQTAVVKTQAATAAAVQQATAQQKVTQSTTQVASNLVAMGTAQGHAHGKTLGLSAAISGMGHQFDMGFMAVRQMMLAFAMLGGPIIAAVAAVAKFDSALHDANSVLFKTEQGFQALSQEVVDLSVKFELATGPLANAQALFQILQAGIIDASLAMEVLKVSSIAATAGMTDTVTAAKMLSGIVNAYGPEAISAAEASDILFKTVEVGSISFQQLSQGIGQSLGYAVNAGVSLEELGTIIATLTNKGMPARQALTITAAILRGLTAQTGKATKVMKEYGLSIDADVVKQKGAINVLRLMMEATNGNAAALRGMMGRGDAANGVLLLMNDESSKLASNMERMASHANASKKAFDEQAKGFRVAWGQFAAAVEVAGIALGSGFLPPLKATITALATSLNWFNQLNDGWKLGIGIVSSLALALTGVVVSIGPLMVLFRSIYTSWSLLTTALKTGTAATTAASTAIKGLGTSASVATVQVQGLAAAETEAALATQALGTARLALFGGLAGVAVGAGLLAVNESFKALNAEREKEIALEEKIRGEFKLTAQESADYQAALKTLGNRGSATAEEIAKAFKSVSTETLRKQTKNLGEQLRTLNQAAEVVGKNVANKQRLIDIKKNVHAFISPEAKNALETDKARLKWLNDAITARKEELKIIDQANDSTRSIKLLKSDTAQKDIRIQNIIMRTNERIKKFQDDQQAGVFETKKAELEAIDRVRRRFILAKKEIEDITAIPDKAMRKRLEAAQKEVADITTKFPDTKKIPPEVKKRLQAAKKEITGITNQFSKVGLGLDIEGMEETLFQITREQQVLEGKAHKERIDDRINTVQELLATEEIGKEKAIEMLEDIMATEEVVGKKRTQIRKTQADLQRAIDKEAFNTQISNIEQALNEGEISTKQAIAQLEIMKKAYLKNAKEREVIETKISVLKKKQRAEDKKESIDALNDQAAILKDQVKQIDIEIDALIERNGTEEELNRLLETRRGLLDKIIKLEGEAAIEGAKNAEDKVREGEKTNENLRRQGKENTEFETTQHKKLEDSHKKKADKIGDLESQIRDQKIQNLERENEKEKTTVSTKIENLQKILQMELQNIEESGRQTLAAMTAEELKGEEGKLARQLIEMQKQAAIEATRQKILDFQKTEEQTFKGTMSEEEFWEQNQRFGQTFGKGAFGGANTFSPGSFSPGSQRPRILPAGVTPPGVPSGGGAPRPTQIKIPISDTPEINQNVNITLTLNGQVELIDTEGLSEQTVTSIFQETGLAAALVGGRPAELGRT